MKKHRTARIISVIMLAVLMLLSCTPGMPFDPSKPGQNQDPSKYSYKEALKNIPVNWNPHSYRTQEENYPADKISMGFYTMIFNDALHPVEGVKEYEGYAFIPEMASEMPIDITEQVKAIHLQYKIPAKATSGYAYRIPLNKAATWENGKKITAQTYVDSMKRLLSPELMNYRASDYYLQQFCIAGAEDYARQGQSTTISLEQAIQESDCASLDEYLEKHGNEKTGYINWNYSFGKWYDFDNYPVENGFKKEGMKDNPKNEVAETPLTIAKLLDFYVLANNKLQKVDEATALSWALDELYVMKDFSEGISWDTVGCYAEDDYNLVIVLSKSLKGFQLLHELSSTWLVETDLYDRCIKHTNDGYISTYNTSVGTTISYGPYRLAEYKNKNVMRFEKNPTWYGWSDGKHVYVDPKDGKTYQMYQTTNVDAYNIPDGNTEDLFLNGELSEWELPYDKLVEYADSEYLKTEPDETVFFLILNGYEDAINKREEAADFDRDTKDLQTILVPAFRKAIAVTYDKELFAREVSPSRTGGYGLIGENYIYNPETGAKYRDTDQAKKILCEVYSVDISQYATLDEAVASITGYNLEKAKELYTKAFHDSIDKGYITDTDNDGISDQTVTIEYCLSADSAFMTKTIAHLNEKMSEATAGTPFEGKVKFIKSKPYGDEWPNKIKEGQSDVILGGWSGSEMNPFSLTSLYTNPAYQYDYQWFDTTEVRLTLTVPVNGVAKELTTNLRNWSDALNGSTVKIDGIEYNFGEGQADIETRLDILAAIEGEVLKTYDYIPLLQNASKYLQSQQIHDVTDNYNPYLGYGGLPYLKYFMTDAEWLEFVRNNLGNLKY